MGRSALGARGTSPWTRGWSFRTSPICSVPTVRRPDERRYRWRKPVRRSKPGRHQSSTQCGGMVSLRTPIRKRWISIGRNSSIGGSPCSTGVADSASILRSPAGSKTRPRGTTWRATSSISIDCPSLGSHDKGRRVPCLLSLGSRCRIRRVISVEDEALGGGAKTTDTNAGPQLESGHGSSFTT